MLKIAIITNIPAPYRIPIYQRIAKTTGVSLQVIFCSQREPNRQWNLPAMDFAHTFLRQRFVTVNERYIHNNFDVISSLKQSTPDVVITTGFNPTHLYAFAYALFQGCAHVPMTDGNYVSEQTLSALHRSIRRFVYARSKAFVSASMGGQMLYKSYGMPLEHCFKSHLCIDNEAFCPDMQHAQKPFDFIFCGRIESVKNPYFALKVVLEVAHRLNRKVRILFVGSGDHEAIVKKEAALWPHLVDAVFSGFAAQHELPHLYKSARLFLFPSLGDAWGVVANEACAAGLPVIVSPYAGVAGELVLDGENGFVCELDVSLWAERATFILTRPDVYQRFSDRSRSLVSEYTFDHAAEGLLAACRFAIKQDGTK